jgi:superfamily I DNA/RNA helicase
MDQSHAPAYRLVRRPLPAASAPRLDEAQQRVVEHEGGPLLVLAGPGTGKTTTIVAAVADRIERRGIDPERVLVLTFSRKAAVELRERITARLRRTTREPLAMTFHSYAYALARREFVLAGDEPPRPRPSSCLRFAGCCAGRPRTVAPAGPSGSVRPWPPGGSPRRYATC